jgi:hypothetical protein
MKAVPYYLPIFSTKILTVIAPEFKGYNKRDHIVANRKLRGRNFINYSIIK